MRGTSTVLVVDDDASVREIVRGGLVGEGYRVLTATDGQAAFDVLHEQPVDLILLDMNMPVMDGWTFARNYHRQEPPWAPVVAFTAAQDAAQAAVAIGANGHLSKPFELLDLLATLERNRQHWPTDDVFGPDDVLDRVHSADTEALEVRPKSALERASRGQTSFSLGQRARTILESITDAFFALDVDWRLTYVNAAAVPLLHHDSDELVGQILWEVFPEAVGSEFAYSRATHCSRGSASRDYAESTDRWIGVNLKPPLYGPEARPRRWSMHPSCAR